MHRNALCEFGSLICSINAILGSTHFVCFLIINQIEEFYLEKIYEINRNNRVNRTEIYMDNPIKEYKIVSDHIR